MSLHVTQGDNCFTVITAAWINTVINVFIGFYLSKQNQVDSEVLVPMSHFCLWPHSRVSLVHKSRSLYSCIKKHLTHYWTGLHPLQVAPGKNAASGSYLFKNDCNLTLLAWQVHSRHSLAHRPVWGGYRNNTYTHDKMCSKSVQSCEQTLKQEKYNTAPPYPHQNTDWSI